MLRCFRIASSLAATFVASSVKATSPPCGLVAKGPCLPLRRLVSAGLLLPFLLAASLASSTAPCQFCICFGFIRGPSGPFLFVSSAVRLCLLRIVPIVLFRPPALFRSPRPLPLVLLRLQPWLFRRAHCPSC
jgi:hypothetical protein